MYERKVRKTRKKCETDGKQTKYQQTCGWDLNKQIKEETDSQYVSPRGTYIDKVQYREIHI